ncbi:MAG: GNAT family N-acetyltransferase [Opitutaceae bacterium]|nr:GNAT family N-acetyltransferase [Opitutaceae bacterium]
MNSEPSVRHNPAASRYEIEVEGHLAMAEYALEGDRIVFTHTFVPPELRGRGIAEKLVRPALEEARRQGRRVVPRCSYVAAFIRRNPEFQPLVGGG